MNMLKKIIKTNIKIFNLAFFMIILSCKLTLADVLKDFKINGNNRISDETIILFSDYKIEDILTSNDLNIIINNLNDTSFFSDIKINFENNILFINVTENPLIQSLKIEGIKRKSLVAQIKESIVQKEKTPFIKSKIKNDQDRILNSLRINGYYFAKINSQIKKNNNNTVDIIYKIDLGDKAVIKKIKFIGNKVFKDNKLKKIIISEESKFWKIISSKKNLDIQRIDLDKNLLMNFYKNNGFYNPKINISYAKIIENNNFELIFNIDAGAKYFFNDLKINIPDEYDKADFNELEKTLNNLSLKKYSLNRIEDILDEIDNIALSKNYEFISATYDELIVENNKINLSINLKDTKKYYISKINITGNSITSEKVIRNELLADEGDPFNELLVNKSLNQIKSLRLFKNVETNIETSENEMTKSINIDVEEQPTGEIFAGAGTGTGGSNLSFGISENNYLGEGIKLGADLTLTNDSINGKIFINEPNYKNTNRAFNRSFERSDIDNLSNFGYETSKTSFSFGTSYEQYKDIYFSPTLLTSFEEINTTASASNAKKKQ